MHNPFDPLPCPFCGHVGVTIRDGSTFRWRVAECEGCGATCGETRFNTLGDDKTVEEISAGRRAMDAWNTRVPPNTRVNPRREAASG